MLALFRDEATLARLETSGRLLRRRFLQSIFVVAAEDLGESLRYLRIADLTARGFDNAQAAWAQVQLQMDRRAQSLDLFGMAPFWFVDCPGWPPSAFLAWNGLHAWAHARLGDGRRLMAASFSADQLILGYADSAEFHNRLTHAHQAPVAQPLFPFPFLLSDTSNPQPISRIDLTLGETVRLELANGDIVELDLR